MYIHVSVGSCLCLLLTSPSVLFTLPCLFDTHMHIPSRPPLLVTSACPRNGFMKLTPQCMISRCVRAFESTDVIHPTGFVSRVRFKEESPMCMLVAQAASAWIVLCSGISRQCSEKIVACCLSMDVRRAVEGRACRHVGTGAGSAIGHCPRPREVGALGT
jgi:hypothetical protein